ncbi:MAG: endonuclease domain-containing protein [Bacteroidaceae bacterium]|jgi:very-short-patch-repair endonuclease|nr:endonuclease domain-containing protein [Bacteroidaceae bacterium]
MTENNIRNIPILKEFRRKLRKNMTPAEIALWQHLKAGKLNGTHWRRQYSVDKYILDFYCPIYKLCIELDGQEHYTMQGDKKDYDRDEFLKSKDITIIRFENREIWENIEMVLEAIKFNLKDIINNQ